MTAAVEVRPYQAAALSKIYADLQVKQEVLLSGMMGCGKTFMSVRLVQRICRENPDMQVLVLMHKQELVDQFEKSFLKFTDIKFTDIGICCAGSGEKTTNRRITIATIQTFVNVKEKYPGAGLIIIDEAHRIDINSDTQYKQVFGYLRLQRPTCRILGITATPARLGHGYIYGKRCKPGSINLFDEISHKITYDELLKSGHLVPLRGVVANHESLGADLAGVSTNGDYVLDQLGEIMSREIHLHTAVEAIEKYCQTYKRICVFCCTIDHAEKLHAIIPGSTILHSKLTQIERYQNMESWVAGDARIITSVNILAEGFDLPVLDCLVFARPTLSSTLFLQAVGRVLRTHPGKDHGFIVDLTDNTSRFGTDLDKIKVTVPKAVAAAEAKERSMWKICPQCDIEVHIALRECSECGFAWPEPEYTFADSLPDMRDVAFVKSPPVQIKITKWKALTHTSKKNGKMLGKIDYFYEESDYRGQKVSLFLCFKDFYSGYAVTMSEKRWESISPDKMPESVGELMNQAKFYVPEYVEVDVNGKYPELLSVICNEDSVVFNDHGEIYDDEVPF